MKTTFAKRSGRADDSLVLRATAVTLLAAMPLGVMAKQQAPASAPVKAPAEASAPTTATYGDWLVTCPPPAATGVAAACEATQTLLLEGKAPIARIAVGRLTKSGDLSFAVMLPAAVEFSAPVVLGSETTEAPAIALGWRRCIPTGCFADATPAGALSKGWIAQTVAGRMTFVDGNGQPVALPFSFKGLVQAVAALDEKR
jgi:invasion protein IalB